MLICIGFYSLNYLSAYVALLCLLVLVGALLAAVLIKLTVRYLEISSLVSFPCLTIVTIFALFHVLGKQAVLKHLLYKAVVDLGKKLKARWRMSLVILSPPGVLF